jgi:hypothetical protein
MHSSMYISLAVKALCGKRAAVVCDTARLGRNGHVPFSIDIHIAEL